MNLLYFDHAKNAAIRGKGFNMSRVKAIGNDGPGIWYDIDSHDCLIEQCWCEGNTIPRARTFSDIR